MKKFLLPLTASLAALSSLHAQTNRAGAVEGAARQVQSVNQNRAQTTPDISPSYSAGQVAPELYPGESEDVGPQLLVLEKAPKVQKPIWFEVALDTQYFYTSNMFLTEKGNLDTGILITTLQAALAPPPIPLSTGQLTLRSGYRQQRYMYGLDKTSNNLNNFDFDVGTAYGLVQYSYSQLWSGFFELDYSRYLSHEENWTEFYTEWVPTWGLERQIPLGEKHLLSVAYTGANHWTYTDPLPTTNVNDRLDSILSLTWSWHLSPSVLLQPYYRVQYTHYWQNAIRNDYFHTLGAALVWQLKPWAALRAFTSWESRDSNDPLIQDYQKFDSGVGLTLALRF
jgi:hypothetical protein